MKAWAGLGYYSRARNLKKCAEVGRDATGRPLSRQRGWPARTARHRRLHGGGDRGDRLRPAGRGRRRQCRARDVAAVRDRNAAAGGEAARSARGSRHSTPAERPGDFAQAMMDLGATICTPKRPALHALSAARRLPGASCPAIPELLRSRRRRRRSRCGAARPSWRVSAGRRDPAAHAPGQGPARRHDRSADHRLDGAPGRRRPRRQARPFAADWRRCGSDHACLHPFRARTRRSFAPTVARPTPPQGHWWSAIADVHGEALPTVMKKVIEVGHSRRDRNADTERTSMTEIRHIVFDIGKVLIHYDPDLPFSRLIPDAERAQMVLRQCLHARLEHRAGSRAQLGRGRGDC